MAGRRKKLESHTLTNLKTLVGKNVFNLEKEEEASSPLQRK